MFNPPVLPRNADASFPTIIFFAAAFPFGWTTLIVTEP
jgi:hypothetical protein